MTAPVRKGIFVNYRVGDCDTEAALLAQLLVERVGGDSVFFASRSITLASDYTKALPDGLDRASVLLAVIGPRWLEAAKNGVRRIELADDWVRRELRTAFEQGTHVVPILMDGPERLTMPREDQLPPDIAALARAQYLRMHYQDLRLDRLFKELVELSPQTLTSRAFTPPNTLPEHPVPSMLLRAEYAVVPFHGRDAEKSALLTWCLGPPVHAARLITGPGGQGKTRLALELCRELDQRGWLAGCVDESCPDDVLVSLVRADAPLLLVLDYVESRTGQLLALAEQITRRPSGWGPVRLLLLSRAAGEWRRTLTDHGDDRVAGLFQALPEQRLAPLTRSDVDRQAEFTRAVHEFAAHVDGARPQDALAPSDLPAERYDRALDVHAAALAALLDEDGTADGTEGSGTPARDPVARVLAHERRYWARTLAVHLLPPKPSEHADALVAAATLFGADSDDGALRLLATVPTFADASATTLRAHLRWAAAILPGGPGLNPLRPDRLGEDHVAFALETMPELADDPVGAVGAVDDSQLLRALTVLGRAAARHDGAAKAVARMIASDATRMMPLGIEVAPQLENPRAFAAILLECLRRNDDDPEAVRQMLAGLPDESVALAELAVLADEISLASARRRAEINPVTTARLLLRYTYHLKNNGQRTEALASAEEATALYDRLAAEDRPRHLPDLGRCLHTLAVTLDESGDRRRGLAEIRRAVAVRRELCAGSEAGEPFPDGPLPGETLPDGPRAGDAYLPELALSLDVLASDLAEAGDWSASLAASREAVRVFERLTAARPSLYTANLATALGNLALQLIRLGSPEQAVRFSERAVRVLRPLADERPDAYLPKLAHLLNGQASALEKAHRPDEALPLATEAVEHLRALTGDGTDRVGSAPATRTDLASALINLSIIQGRTGRPDLAWKTATEAVAAHRPLAALHPDVYRPRLAMALNALAIRCDAVARTPDAVTAAAEAVDIHRSRPDDDPYPLAGALANLAAFLAKSRDWPRSAAAAREAADLCAARPAGAVPEHTELLAGTLHTLGAASSHIDGAGATAVKAIDASVALRRRLAEERGGGHRRTLVGALTAQLVLHERAGLPDTGPISTEIARLKGEWEDGGRGGGGGV